MYVLSAAGVSGETGTVRSLLPLPLILAVVVRPEGTSQTMGTRQAAKIAADATLDVAEKNREAQLMLEREKAALSAASAESIERYKADAQLTLEREKADLNARLERDKAETNARSAERDARLPAR
jgi:hypothetical protein